MVACLWQSLPGKRNLEIMELIQQTGHLANNPTNLLGYGIPDYMNAYDIATTDTGLEISVDNGFIIRPNPFENEFTITFNDE